MYLDEAVKTVQEKFPDMSPRVVVEKFPSRYSYSPAQVYTYQFMTEDGMNIATFFPMFGTLMFQPGEDGRGRPYEILIQDYEDVTPLMQGEK